MTTNNAKDDALLAYATPRQAEYLQAYWTAGTYPAAAAQFGVHPTAIRQAFDRVRAKAARQGHAPENDMTRTAPDGFHVKGVSTYYNDEGKPIGQWVKTSIDQARQHQLLQAAAVALGEDIPRAEPTPAPPHTLAQLLNCYVVTDYHLGAKAWGEETGADWDTGIAERLLVDWFAAAIEQAPDADQAVFAQLGDFLHFDGITPVTPTSGHLLDADTRFQRVIRVAIRVIRQVIGMLLTKHRHIHVLMAEGNHDIASSMWLRELFAVLYENEPRITVIRRPDPYYCVEHGSTSLFFHHGHKRRSENLETTLVAKFRDVFGRTRHSYAHTGHLHHNVMRETNTMQIEQHRTLAAPDSHASRGGWMSGRDAKVITYHAQYGEVGRIIVSPDMLAQ